MLDLAFVVQNAVRHDGQGRAALEAIRTAALRGHRVTVYAHALDGEGGRGVEFAPIPRRPGPQAADDLAMLRSATAAVDRGDHDVACVVGPTALPRCPTVLYAHFSFAGWRRTWTHDTRPGPYHRMHARLAERLERRCAAHADLVVVPSGALARDVARTCDETPVEVIPDGIDLDEYPPVSAAERAAARTHLGLPDERFVFAFIGDYSTPRKGLASLLHGLAASRVQATLLVAGRGDHARYRRLADRLGIAGQLVFTGFEPGRRVIAASDAIAVPSHYEPFSLVAVEAAASTVPVILSGRAGAASVLSNAALVIEDPADTTAVASALRHVHSMPVAERQALARRARARVEPLDWPSVSPRVVSEMERLATSRTGASS